MEPTKNKKGFDKKTQVLTDKGWKLFKDLNKNLKICTVDKKTFEPVFEKPKKIISGIFTGKILTVEDEYLNIAITPGKTVLVGDCKSDWRKTPVTKWSRIPSEDLDNISTRLLLAAKSKAPSLFSTRLARVIGLLCYRCAYLEDSVKLLIPYINKEERNKIIAIGYPTSPLDKGIVSITIGKDVQRIQSMLDQRKDIALPGDINSYGYSDLLAIFEGMSICSDSAGRTKKTLRGKYGHFWIKDREQTFNEQLSILGSLHGLSVRTGSVAALRSTVQKFQNLNIGVLSHYSRDNKAATNWEDYDGLVYDVITSSGIIITRRNGLTWICLSKEEIKNVD